MTPPIMGYCMECRRPARRHFKASKDLMCKDCIAALANEGRS